MRFSKYGNKPVKVDGFKFPSKAEAKRYGELLLLQKAKQISDLKIHPEFYLSVNGVEVCKYVGDFSYWTEDGERQYILEDVKGIKTRVYMLKKKLMLACLGINVTEVRVRA